MQNTRFSNLIAFSLIVTLIIGTLGTVSADYSGDDDGDGISNDSDKCFNQNSNWNSNTSTDADADGCLDSTEDDDDDNDMVLDQEDLCPISSSLGWNTNQVYQQQGNTCLLYTSDAADE